jgi:hypothetical protein
MSTSAIYLELIEREKVQQSTSVDASSNAQINTALAAVKTDYDLQMLHATIKTSSAVSSDFAPTDDQIPDWFNDDTDLPYYDPSNPKYSLLGKLREMLEFIKLHPGNTKAPQMLMQYISKLETANPKLAETLLNTSFEGSSLIDNLISLQIQMKFFYSGDTHLDQSGFFDELLNMFKGDSSLYAQAESSIQNWRDKWSSFVTSNTDSSGKPIWTYEQYQQLAKMYFDGFNPSSTVSQYNKLIFDAMESQYGKYSVAELFALVMSNLDGDTFDDVGSYGSTADWMKKRTTDINDLLSQWTAGDFDESKSISFIDAIKDELWKFNSPEGDGPGADIDGSIGTKGFLNMETTYKDSTGKAYTINDLYTMAKNGDATAKTELATTLQSWSMPSDPSKTVPTQFTQIQNYFKTATSALSDQSQTITTQLQKLTNDEQSYDNIENKSLSDYMDLINAILKKTAE